MTHTWSFWPTSTNLATTNTLANYTHPATFTIIYYMANTTIQGAQVTTRRLLTQLSDDDWREVRMLAVQRDQTLQQLVASVLLEAVAREKACA